MSAPSSPASPMAPSMVSLPRALGSTPVAATPRPASTVATDAAQEVTSTAAAEQLGRTVPRLYVEFLLVDGSRKAYQIGSEMTVGAVKKAVWNAWPEGFSKAGQTRPANVDGLRILFLGKFLPEDTTFASLNLPPHETTIIHLNIKAPVPDPNDISKPSKGKAGNNPCGRCCVIG